MSHLGNEVGRADQGVASKDNHRGLLRYTQKLRDIFQASSRLLGRHQIEILFRSKNTSGLQLEDFFHKWKLQNLWIVIESHLLTQQFLRQ